jgi:predicted transposase YbfD/YdcC
MDVLQCTPLVAYLKTLPDPRDPRGVRHPWWVILTIAAAARMAGQRSDKLTALWARYQRSTLRQYLPLYHGQTPSQSTFQRAFATLDIEAFEATISSFVQGLGPPPGPALRGLALDGKGVNGASRHGARTHLLSVVEHGSGRVLRQCNVAEKTNEIPVARRLLAGWDLAGAVVTGDAMHCQKETAAQVLDQGGDYLFAVKDNQPELRQALEYLFSDPRQGRHAPDFRTCVQTSPGHGRVETRRLEASSALDDWLAADWPQVGQVIHRVCRRTVGGRTSEEHHYWITSLTAEEASPETLEQLCRGHWTIENRVHYCRDVTFGEDAADQRCGAAPQARAALTNAIMALFRASGVRYLPEALCYYQAHPAKALQHLGCRRL